MYDDIILFTQLVKCGSYSTTATILGIPQPTISRRIKNLEELLGVSLLKRDTHNFSLTDAGNTLFHKFKDHAHYIENAIEHLKQQENTISGRLRVALPITVSIEIINPHLGKFMQDHPELELDIDYINTDFDMLRSDYDIAIISHLPERPTQKIRKLYSAKLVACCSDEYIKQYGEVRKLGDLANHHVILKNNDLPSSTIAYRIKDGKATQFYPKSKMLLNSCYQTIEIAQAHHAIAVCLEEHYKQSNLIQILPNYHFGIVDYYLMSNSSEHNNKAQAFINFIGWCFNQIVS
ncbi:MAG: LysR family transcriptional regulator [Neisseriales bacterium]|nr:MAG: LysR family transcriptional regulator [Neisseriales bacterium]